MRRLVALLAFAAAACGGFSGSTPIHLDFATGAINVFAATSLTSAFGDEKSAFQTQHPKATLDLNFNGSSTLATQINQGAPADVFASADLPNMQKVTSQSQTFASNRLEIVVAPGNPKHITGLGDLAHSGVIVVLCAPAVPCGSYAGQALAKAGVQVTPSSQEQNVGGVIGKVESGDADAGIVYTTDVKAAGSKVSGVAIPDSQNVVASYPIALVKGAPNPNGGQTFIEFILSAQGQAILGKYGFGKP